MCPPMQVQAVWLWSRVRVGGQEQEADVAAGLGCRLQAVRGVVAGAGAGGKV